VAFNTSDAQTALDAITALNANGTFAAKATATSGGSGVITITWDTKGTVGNTKTLTASRTAGTATVGGNGTTLGGGAQGQVTITIDGTAVVTNTTTLSNSAAATACAAALEADSTLGPLLTAIGDGADVEITWGEKGVVGNSITLEATSVTGTATVSDVTLLGGLDNDVTVTVGGFPVVTDTTNLSNADAATAVAAALNADTDVTTLATASAASNVVTITAAAAGEEGNGISLAAITDAGTATANAANLSGGTSFTYNL
jgi:phage tail sheath gpL-like